MNDAKDHRVRTDPEPEQQNDNPCKHLVVLPLADAVSKSGWHDDGNNYGLIAGRTYSSRIRQSQKAAALFVIVQACR